MSSRGQFIFKDIVIVVKQYPIRLVLLCALVFLISRAYFTRHFIWPFSHQTVMYSEPTIYPFERLYLVEADTLKMIKTTEFVERPSKLSFLYLKYHRSGKSYDDYLAQLLENKKITSQKKIFLKREWISEFKPLCSHTNFKNEVVACLNRGKKCENF